MKIDRRGRPRDPKVQEIMEKCRDLGIAYTTYLRRLQIGWTKEEALSVGKVGAYLRMPNGESVYSYMKKINKSYSTFNNLIHLGFSREEAIEGAINCKGRTKYYRDGMSLRKYCAKNGLDYTKEYYQEVKKNGKIAR